MIKLHIEIDIQNCERQKIPVDAYQEALRKEFVNCELSFSQSLFSGYDLHNGTGIVVIESECENEHEECKYVKDRISSVLIGLIEDYTLN